jgi:hypothetical protein
MITNKQRGDAGEMLVAAELTLAGIPAFTVPANWPGYDVVADPLGGEMQRISVKARTFKAGGSDFVEYDVNDIFDWLAIVILPGGIEPKRRFFLIPRRVADENVKKDSPTSKTANLRYCRIDKVSKLFAAFENNFLLDPLGRTDPHSFDKRP